GHLVQVRGQRPAHAVSHDDAVAELARDQAQGVRPAGPFEIERGGRGRLAPGSPGRCHETREDSDQHDEPLHDPSPWIVSVVTLPFFISMTERFPMLSTS